MASTTADLVAGEATVGTVRPARTRWVWGVVAASLLAWSCYQLGFGRRELVNWGGFGEVGDFFRSAISPDLTPEVRSAAWRGLRVTLAYAVLGTAGSALVGIPVGIIAATRWRRPTRRSKLAGLVRIALIPARGSHEILWALLLLNILGINPLVAVLAITVPFGAVTAKVVSQLLDDAYRSPAIAVRATGASAGSVLVFGLLPIVWRDVMSYVSYRFECAVRAAAVLGVAGAGGLGQELRLSFQSLEYRQMWTFLWVLIVVGGVADAVTARLRTRRSGTDRRSSIARWIVPAGLVLAAVWAWVELGLEPSTLWSQRSRTLLGELIDEWFPPEFAAEHVRVLWRLTLQTLAISVVSAVLAFAVAMPAAFLAARRPGDRRTQRVGRQLARWVLLGLRAIPPSVWAYLAVLMFFPGPLPAAVALALYNAGVLGRLLGEVVENLEQPTISAVAGAGGSSVASFAYSTFPLAIRRFSVYGLYRWEVALRETVVVGIVAAGGLGQHLGSRLAAFDYPEVTATVAAFVLLTVLVDVVSGKLRNAVIA